jgi:hypothetical protein
VKAGAIPGEETNFESSSGMWIEGKHFPTFPQRNGVFALEIGALLYLLKRR